MDKVVNFISWTCHVCGGHYDEKDGGLCTRCGEVACDRHLRVVQSGDTSGEREQLICIECMGDKDITVSMLWWKLRKGFSKLEE